MIRNALNKIDGIIRIETSNAGCNEYCFAPSSCRTTAMYKSEQHLLSFFFAEYIILWWSKFWIWFDLYLFFVYLDVSCIVNYSLDRDLFENVSTVQFVELSEIDF